MKNENICKHTKTIKNSDNMLVCVNCAEVIEERVIENTQLNEKYIKPKFIQINCSIQRIELKTKYVDSKLAKRNYTLTNFNANVESILSFFQIPNIYSKIEEFRYLIFDTKKKRTKMGRKKWEIFEDIKIYYTHEIKTLAFAYLIISFHTINFENFCQKLCIFEPLKKISILLFYTILYAHIKN